MQESSWSGTSAPATTGGFVAESGIVLRSIDVHSHASIINRHIFDLVLMLVFDITRDGSRRCSQEDLNHLASEDYRMSVALVELRNHRPNPLRRRRQEGLLQVA